MTDKHRWKNINDKRKKNIRNRNNKKKKKNSKEFSRMRPKRYKRKLINP